MIDERTFGTMATAWVGQDCCGMGCEGCVILVQATRCGACDGVWQRGDAPIHKSQRCPTARRTSVTCR